MTPRRVGCFRVKQVWRALAARLPDVAVGRLVGDCWNSEGLSRADVTFTQRLGDRCRDLLRRKGLLGGPPLGAA
jgi:hypothetical protein